MRNRALDFFALNRPDTTQALLRLFAAGTGPDLVERLRYLARPHYRMIEGKLATAAGDGRVLLWAWGRVPGFRDYEVPPAGYGYADVPSMLTLSRRGGGIVVCPSPAGPWLGNAADDVVVLQAPGRVRRWDLARLSLLDDCRLGPGEEIKECGHRIGWRSLSIEWRHGSASGAGVLLCGEPSLCRMARTAAKRRAQKISA